MTPDQKRFFLILVLILTAFLAGTAAGRFLPAPMFSAGGGTLESKVRTQAKDYPKDACNKWAWCYNDSVAEWSTDQKLREDVRLKSVLVLSAEERRVLSPLAEQIAAAVAAETSPLKERYAAVGSGLKTADWTPGSPLFDALKDEGTETPGVVPPRTDTPRQNRTPPKRKFLNRLFR